MTTRRPFAHIYSMEDLRATADYLGSYFFSVDTMRSFKSRLMQEVRVAESIAQRHIVYRYSEEMSEIVAGETEPVRIEVLFVTSERDVRHAWEGKRRYTLRRATILPHTGDLADKGDFIEFDTIGDFGQYATLKEARAALRQTPHTEWTNDHNAMKEVSI